MKSKVFSFVLGFACLFCAFIMCAIHAWNDYGILKNELHVEVLAQSGTTGNCNCSACSCGSGTPAGGSSNCTCGNGGGSSNGGGTPICLVPSDPRANVGKCIKRIDSPGDACVPPVGSEIPNCNKIVYF